MKVTNFDKGFIQGMTTVTMSTGDKTTIPKRYVKTLEKSSRNQNITITWKKKGGAIILNGNTYY